MNEEALIKEYYAILEIVTAFDQRLMTVKGWGVTLSLAALAWGFEKGHSGLFLVAALSGLGFWLIEGTMKRHQMRYYVRMREIEVLQHARIKEKTAQSFSSPRIDWSWSSAHLLYKGKPILESSPVPLQGPRRSYLFAWFFPHVCLPHMVSVVAGLVLFCLSFRGTWDPMTW